MACKRNSYGGGILTKQDFIRKLYEENCFERDVLNEAAYPSAQDYYFANMKHIDNLWNEYEKTGKYPLFS